VPTFAEVRKGIKTTLEDPVIPGLSVYDKINPQVNYPGVVVHPDEADYTMAFRQGVVKWDINLLVLVGGLETVVMQDLLDELVSPYGEMSISQAIYNNRTLGLPNCDAHVRGVNRYWVRYLSAHYGASLKMHVVFSK